jgi:hypothetical protein
LPGYLSRPQAHFQKSSSLQLKEVTTCFDSARASQNEDSYFPSLSPSNGGTFSPTHHQMTKVTYEIFHFSNVCILFG